MSLKATKGINLLLSITAANAESNAKAALNLWKQAQNESDWNESAADNVGLATVTYSSNWKRVVLNDLESQKANLEAQKSRFEQQFNDAKAEMARYEIWINESENVNKSDTSSNIQLKVSQSKKKITNPKLWNEAHGIAVEAEKCINDTKKKISDVDSKIRTTKKDIDNFISEVYKLKLMNESKAFMNGIINAGVISDKSMENKIKSQCFYVSSKYRKNFDDLEKIINESKTKLKTSYCNKNPESMVYGGTFSLNTEKKVREPLTFGAKAEDSSSMHVLYEFKKDFVFKKDSVENGVAKLNEAKKTFEIANTGNVVSLKLLKKLENETAVEEIQNIIANAETFKAEAENLVKVAMDNGASTNRFALLGNKIINWWNATKVAKYLAAHPKAKKACKIGGISLLGLVVVLTAGISVGTYINNNRIISRAVGGSVQTKVIGETLNVDYLYRTNKTPSVYFISEDKMEAAKELIVKLSVINACDVSETEVSIAPDYIARLKKSEKFEKNGKVNLFVSNSYNPSGKPFIDLLEVSMDEKKNVVSCKGTRYKFDSAYIEFDETKSKKTETNIINESENVIINDFNNLSF